MVRPEDMRRVPQLMSQATRRVDAMLVQAISHETSGCYYVLAKQIGRDIGYLNPDCSGDYRRQKRLWLHATELLRERRWCRNLHTPSVADEFCYYLIKKVLKQSITECQVRRLGQLYQLDPVRCVTRTFRFWSPTTSDAMKRALLQQDLNWFVSHLPELRDELLASVPVEGILGRLQQRLRDAKRIASRLVNPTGMSVLICGGIRAQRLEIAGALLRALAPAFRHTKSVSLEAPCFASVRTISLAARAAFDRLQSTLTVETLDWHHSSPGLAPKTIRLAARLLFRPDLVFVLQTDETKADASSFLRGGDCARTIPLDATLPAEEMLEMATRVILYWLSRRLARRLGLGSRCESEVASPASSIEPEPAVPGYPGGI